MAPSEPASPQPPQMGRTLTQPMQRQLRRLSKDIRGKVVSTKEFGGHDSREESPLSSKSFALLEYGPIQFGEALLPQPKERSRAAVRAALDWWLKSNPTSGFELSPELRAEHDILLDMFMAGRLHTCTRNQVIQEEGDEVKHYCVILFGQVKLRCAKPAVAVAPVIPNLDGTKDDSQSAVDAYLNIETLGRGESLGLYPGEARSPYNVVCSSDKVTLLRLTLQDYEYQASGLACFHREHFAKMVQFMKSNLVFPESTDQQLRRIAPLLRQRRVNRGQVFIRSGEMQRHIHFLKEGACSVLVHDTPETSIPMDEDEAHEKNEEELCRHDDFLKMRATSYGPRMQQAAAYDQKRAEVVKNLARGPLRKTLGATSSGHAFRVSNGNMHASASLNEPGVMLGEEALVHDNLREWSTLRNCYSVRATKNCVFFVGDITVFKLLRNMGHGDEASLMVSEKLTRRCKQFTRGRNVAQSINQRAQELKAAEYAKASRQKLRLPTCAGYPAVDELENIEDYLDIIFEHRKAPPNVMQLPTLVCLEGLPYGPNKGGNGPAVGAVLDAMADGGGFKPRKRSYSREWLDSSSYEENPMGSSVCAEARYMETAPPGGFMNSQLAIQIQDTSSPPKALKNSESLPQLNASGGTSGWGGVFLNTEIDFEDGMTISMQSEPIHMLTLSTSSSAPTLPLEQQLALAQASIRVQKELSPKASVSKSQTSAALSEAKTDAKSIAAKRQQKVMKTFKRVMVNKNVLILTDKVDLRKQITRVLVGDDTALVFIKTTNDLWKRLRDGKEEFHLLLLDLTKAELQVEPLLRTLRQVEKYRDLQIIVISQDHDLPEVVRNSCSFAVFLPLAAQMLREAFVWCFDRKSGHKLFPAEEPRQDLGVVKGRSAASTQLLGHIEPMVVSVN